MKKLCLLSFLIIFSSCKETEEKKEVPIKELTTAEKIANAHGYENWHKVKTFAFTFGGKIEDPNSGRAWVWNPKTNDIKLTRNGEIIEYNRNNMDSIALKTDRGFINDKFWALIPFQLIWDEGTTISEPTKAESPIKKQELNKIVLTYSNKGGYTPGDAYDIYYDDAYIIREWNFRRGNAPEPTISNTFEDYQDFNGLKIALSHKRGENERNLLLRNIKVEMEE
ncbi:hypothetical protein [Pontimicrobium aquaticum]|uniref:Uncharacterized protein n=1 Tax=Pontimicrobium aquaticum TaxID=2565367 RepID=A0A4U0EWV3_9FLAO|nr:hypothetical protein [Pontimicrobium aquaticum]TJY36436.1 hypothetical protein E5167_07175 [Pontimicrobium aquaticum]